MDYYNPKLAALNDKISPYIGGNPVRIDGKPRASGILDTVRVYIFPHRDEGLLVDAPATGSSSDVTRRQSTHRLS